MANDDAIKSGLVIVTAFFVNIQQSVYSIYVIFSMAITNLSLFQTEDH